MAGQCQLLVDAGLAAVQARACLCAFQLGLCASRVRLRLLQLLARHDARLEQGLLALQLFVRPLQIGLRSCGVGLGGAELRGGQFGQRGTGGDGLSHVGLKATHASGKGGIQALGAAFIPHQSCRQIHHLVRGGLCRFGGQQVELCMSGRVAQLLALEDGQLRHRRRGRGGLTSA